MSDQRMGTRTRMTWADVSMPRFWHSAAGAPAVVLRAPVTRRSAIEIAETARFRRQTSSFCYLAGGGGAGLGGDELRSLGQQGE